VAEEEGCEAGRPVFDRADRSFRGLVPGYMELRECAADETFHVVAYLCRHTFGYPRGPGVCYRHSVRGPALSRGFSV